MLTAEEYLKLVASRGQGGKPLHRVYGNMLKYPELFINAYGKLYKNKGAMTPGVDGETVDGTSTAKLLDLIEELKRRDFRWSPVQRTYIPKKGGKRPLGIPTWKNKVVQEVMKVILTSYYEPQFSSKSHGFRPERGCHTALAEIQKWRGVKWFIEGDIKGCFDNVNFDILINILGEKIQDQSFLKLIRTMLEAGYMEDWKYQKTYSGTPQGGIASPLLANIYLDKLDQFVAEIAKSYNRGEQRKGNPEYKKIESRMRRAKARQDWESYQTYKQQLKTLPGRDPYDDNFRRLWYVRYADDFLLGFTGPYREAEQIKEKIKQFLEKELALAMSEEKTFITQAQKKPARFLNYHIQYPITRRATIGQPVFRIPNDVIIKWVRKYSRKGKPHQIGRRIYLSDYEIVQVYGAEFRGLYNYYKYALNVRKLSRVKHVMTQSLVKTLAAKHTTKASSIYKKYGTKEQTKAIVVTTETGHKTKFGGFSLTWVKRFKPIKDELVEPGAYYGRNELVSRLNRDVCEIPDCNNKAVEGHHIKSLKTLKKRYQGKPAPEWAKAMIGRNRKTLMVCLKHHQEIHSGRYDGPNLRKLN